MLLRIQSDEHKTVFLKAPEARPRGPRLDLEVIRRKDIKYTVPPPFLMLVSTLTNILNFVSEA